MSDSCIPFRVLQYFHLKNNILLHVHLLNSMKKSDGSQLEQKPQMYSKLMYLIVVFSQARSSGGVWDVIPPEKIISRSNQKLLVLSEYSANLLYSRIPKRRIRWCSVADASWTCF